MLISELGLRLGEDPRGFAEFRALRDELKKLSHPACPDVDWLHVERLCLALQQDNGLELQSMVVLILARAHLYALPGLLEGMQSLNRRLPFLWGQLWPPALSARLELLSWLFDQLQPLLRAMELVADDLPQVQQLNVELEDLSALLMQYAQVPLVSLQALCQQLERALMRMSREAIPGDLLALPNQTATYARVSGVVRHTERAVAPQRPEVIVVTLDSAPVLPREKGTTKGLIWLWGLLFLAVASAGGWGYWRWNLAPVEAKFPVPIQLDSLLLFPPGSAELRPEATKVLITGLMNIKAQPNWLIVITGHSDSSGEDRKNLEISRARALAVKDWMQRMGDIPDDCFIVQGFGAGQPLMDNGTEAGRAANRRVDVRLIPQEGACRATAERPKTAAFP